MTARRWSLAGAGLVLFHLCSLWAGREDGLWLPNLGLGLALVAWLGQGIVPLLALDIFLTRVFFRVNDPLLRIAGDSLLMAAETGLSWLIYARLAKGARRLEDPRSATVFLILIPGALAAAAACVQALYWGFTAGPDEPFWVLAGRLWISRALGILSVTPPLLAVVTPFLVRGRLIHPEPQTKLPGGSEPEDWTWGEVIETAGLCLGEGLLAIVIVVLHVNTGAPSWPLWGLSLLVIVWAALRQGLRGGSLTALVGTGVALTIASLESAIDFSSVQGNLLAQGSTALLVGASAGWIRASEARYRQVVGHIPVILYSARLPRGMTVAVTSADSPKDTFKQRAQSSAHVPSGRVMAEQAEVTLVSPASRAIFGCAPEDLLGPYEAWLERVDPADLELVFAALGQLRLQRHPVVCEYRVLAPQRAGQAAPAVRWVRDTLVAHHASENSFSGWEGVIEDITEQRTLAQSLRRSSGMLEALLTHLPAGVFFVQGPNGHPILVNQRARQLLGRREDLAASIDHLPEVYRLHRPDGSVYPAHELPVAKALRHGMTSMANDVVVHRADGHRVPLVTWAAPVDWTGMGNPDAAVWVLEDLIAMEQTQQPKAQDRRGDGHHLEPGQSKQDDQQIDHQADHKNHGNNIEP